MIETNNGLELSRIEYESPERATINLLQWNIWNEADPKTVLLHLQEICGKESVNVVCLQEFDETQAEHFAEVLDMPYYATSTARHLELRGKPHGKKDSLITFSKFPFENDPLRLSLTEDGWRFFSEIEPGENYLEVDLKLPGGKNLKVGNFHSLPSRYAKSSSRKAEANELYEIIEDRKDKPFVLAGDRNSGEKSYAARKLSEFLIPNKETGIPTTTSKRWEGRLGRFGRYIRREYDQTYLSSQLEATRSKVLPAGPSDHNPTITAIKV